MTRPLRILLIEDSTDDEQLIRAELRRHGVQFELLRVETREALEEQLRSASWDIALADYQLPSLDAEEALEVVKASGVDLPFIIVSGSIGEDVAVRAMKAGAADYFSKENVVRLVPAIRREVAERVARAEKRRLEQDLAASLATEQRLRAEAERANRVKDEFLAMVSHELRTPLNTVLGRVALLEHAELTPEARRQALEVIRRTAEHQVHMVEDLLDISRLAAGKLTIDTEAVDVQRAVSEALQELAAKAGSQGTTLEADLNAAGLHIRGDHARVRQIARNLLANAITFGGPGSTVRVALSRHGDEVELSVSDDGPGIAPELLPHLFDRFVQADQSITRRHGGLGLGLAITRELVLLHGGDISAGSAPGRGATFTVGLPIAGAADSPQLAGRTQASGDALGDRQALSGIRVLVVEDNDDARELMRDLLVEYGAEVREADSARSALEAVPAFVPNVIVSDIGMPDMDGYDLLRELRQRGIQTPAIALTAFASAEDRQRALAAGFAVHLTKPVKLEQLIAELKDSTSNE